MRCDPHNGACVNCGGSAVDDECPAEVHLSELLAMEAGDIPKRAVRMTWAQTQTLTHRRPDLLTREEIKQLLPDLTDPTLIGNRLAAITTALGIPPCGGCESRQEWLNRAHLLVRQLFPS